MITEYEEQEVRGKLKKIMTRRQLLRSAGLTAGLLAAGVPLTAIPDGRQKFRIGMAATEWLASSPTTATYWKACSAIGEIGIGAVEPDNGAASLDVVYGTRVPSFTERSIRTGVCLTGVYQALPLHDSARLGEMRAKISSLARFLKAAGAQYLNLGWDVPRYVPSEPAKFTPEDVKNAVRTMDELGKVSGERHGIPLAYHAERDTTKEVFRQLMDKTNPKNVHWCADVGHLSAIGFDAIQILKEYYSRLRVSHWKDFDPNLPGPKYLGGNARGDFVEVGKGIVNFHAIAAIFLDRHFDGLVMIELDRTREPSILGSARQMVTFVTDELKLKFYKTRHRSLESV
jgi:sugar phosphate isomerase/epimerase